MEIITSQSICTWISKGISIGIGKVNIKGTSKKLGKLILKVLVGISVKEFVHGLAKLILKVLVKKMVSY